MRVLSYGDNPLTSTGYGQVWENLLTRWIKLKPDWEFYHVGWQNHNRFHQTKEGYYMLPLDKLEYGFDTVTGYLLQYKPEIFVTLADVGITAGFIDPVGEARKKGWMGKWIAYTPFDTETWEEMLWSKILDFPDANVAMASNGTKQMVEHNVRNNSMIAHGVDTKKYFPIENKEELKTKFKMGNKFIAGFVGRNQRRKMLANLIKGFSRFSKDKDDVGLLFHTDKESPAGWTIPCIIAKFEKVDKDLAKKVLFSKTNLDIRMRQKITPETMNELYNLMDVFCYATGGEGFGLPGIECQSAGVPLIMTDYSSARHLTNDGKHGLLIPVLRDKHDRLVTEIGNNGVENAIPDDIEIANALEKAYQDWKSGGKWLNEEKIKAREFALSQDWDIIAPQWISLFEKEA